MTASKNIVWHHGKLTAADRESHLKQKGAVIWLTGLSGSGKSSVAHEVELALVQNGLHAFVLDGDNVRHGLNKDLGFTEADRTENIRRIGEVVKLIADANVVVLAAFVSPYRADRAAVRSLVGNDRFVEVHCAATLDDCEGRDVKGLYKKARAGEVKDFTGISAPYETPEKPELRLETGKETLETSTNTVLTYLKGKKII